MSAFIRSVRRIGSSAVSSSRSRPVLVCCWAVSDKNAAFKAGRSLKGQARSIKLEDCLKALQIAEQKANEGLMTQLCNDAPETIPNTGKGPTCPSLMGLRAQSHTKRQAPISPSRGLQPKPHHRCLQHQLSLCVHLDPQLDMGQQPVPHPRPASGLDHQPHQLPHRPLCHPL